MNDSLPTTSRRGFLKLVGVMGAASAFAGTLSACGTTPASRTTTGASGGASASGSTITAAISYELGTNGFDPMTTTAALTVAANWHTMEGLTEILPSGNRDVYAALGKELPKKVGDTTYEVTLRDGATFHNGSPVTADLSIETLKASAAVESVQAFGLLFAMFNCGSAPFNNVKNRQAFLYALDMEKVVKTAYLGNATPATSFVQNTHPSYKQAKVVYAFDQAKAKALLAETGLKSIRLLCTDHGWVKKATPIIKVLRTSADEGRTWSPGVVADAGGAAYSALAPLADGTLGLLYEAGDYDALIFRRVTRADLGLDGGVPALVPRAGAGAARPPKVAP